jgi:Fe-S-cluster-containing dehydrogenase component
MAATGPPKRPGDRLRLPLVDDYLREQQELTAVERFARAAASRPADVPADAPADAPADPIHRRYRARLPATPPAGGQQYAFEVDLDACTGCKACVTACHNLNGLDDGETWRAAFVLYGGSAAAPVKQTVSTACHHCVDPACLKGCPVGAYEKQPITGIVKHLDDQCIGCQYCMFTCPYEVPQYSAKRGIVRKCDMCSDRLAAGEAPACVQACPSHAIAITVIDQHQAREAARGQHDARALLGRLELLVVQDMYATTETARLAHLVLPAAGWGEKAGTFINSERRIGLIKRVARAPGQALSDFHIFQLLAHAWGVGALFERWSSPEAVFRILAELTRGQPCDISGIAGYDELERCGGIQWPLPAGTVAMPGAERRLFEDGRFYHPDGKARLITGEPVHAHHGAAG